MVMFPLFVRLDEYILDMLNNVNFFFSFFYKIEFLNFSLFLLLDYLQNITEIANDKHEIRFHHDQN
jgi:hypothetical protein